MPPPAIKDWSLEERRLQSVYDDVENSRYKVALTQLDRHLKKQPKSQPALVLRAYVLHKLEHPVQTILKIWESIEQTGELSSRSLWWTSLILREIRRYDILLKLYQNLWNSRPTSVSIGEIVFLTAVACWDLDVMCTSSRKMYNVTRSDIWARVAAWAEWVSKCQPHLLENEYSYPPPNPSALRVSLTLLSTTRKQIQSSDILWLHAQIYLAAGMEEEALSMMATHGMNGSIARQWYRIQTLNEILKRRKERNDQKGTDRVVAEIVKQQITRMRDDEDLQRNYANYTFLNDAVVASFKYDFFLGTMGLHDHINQLIGQKERAPALAELDLDCKLAQMDPKHENVMPVECWIDLIDIYWNRWGSKGCVIEDLLSVCKGREKALKGILIEQCSGSYNTLGSYLKTKHARLLLYRIDAENFSPTERDFNSAWHLYLSGRQYALNTPKTDIKPADEIGLAAAQISILLWNSTKEDKYLFRAVLCLRQLVEDSPSNAYAKVLLINVYRILGAFNLTFELFTKLDLKEIQLDTMAYPLMDRCTTDIVFGQGVGVFDLYKASAENMYNKTVTDMPEYMKQALENESYSKPLSMFKLSQTLQHSYSALNLAMEASSIASITSQELKLSYQLKEVVKDHELIKDTYDWSMLPTLVGKKEMRSVLGAEGWDVDAKGLKGSYEVLRAVRRFEDGVFEKCEVDLDTVKSNEQRMLRAICDVINQAVSILASNNTPDTNGETKVEIQKSCSDFLSRITELPAHRWDTLHSGILLVQFGKLLQTILAKITEMAKPKKGKKADINLSALIKDIKDVQSKIKETMKSFSDALIPLKEHKLSLGLDTMEGVEDAFAKKVEKEVNESRISAIDNLLEMLDMKS